MERATSILVVHPDRKTQRVVHRILGVTGHAVEIADSLARATAALAAAAPRLVVIDAAAALEPDADEFFARARAAGVEACLTLLGAPSADRVPQLLGRGAVTNLLVHAMPVLAEELAITAYKLLRGDLFGAEKYLLWGTELHAVTLERASQRAQITAELADALRARGQSTRVAAMARLVADELISNAVHNAPVDDAGVHVRRELPRDRELELTGRHRVHVRWGCDARYVAVEVADEFGSLGERTILGALARREVQPTGGGAGLGLSLAYRSCDHLVFNLAPNRRTEIIALIDVRYRATERAPASSYNVFVEKAP